MVYVTGGADGNFYWIDEYGIAYGPYRTKEEAEAALTSYTKLLDRISQEE